MHSEHVAKNRPKYCQITKLWWIMVGENDRGNRFTASFKADVILRMRK